MVTRESIVGNTMPINAKRAKVAIKSLIANCSQSILVSASLSLTLFPLSSLLSWTSRDCDAEPRLFLFSSKSPSIPSETAFRHTFRRSRNRWISRRWTAESTRASIALGESLVEICCSSTKSESSPSSFSSCSAQFAYLLVDPLSLFLSFCRSCRAFNGTVGTAAEWANVCEEWFKAKEWPKATSEKMTPEEKKDLQTLLGKLTRWPGSEWFRDPVRFSPSLLPQLLLAFPEDGRKLTSILISPCMSGGSFR
jgi:hypothetical protein